MNSYILSRQWFNFAFDNPSKVNPNHGAIYFWLIELANRLGWPPEFGNPATQAMQATGIKSYNTYKKAFDELVSFGFVEVRQASKNQYTATVIALSIFDKALTKALDKAISGDGNCFINFQQSTIQSSSESTCNINKPQTTNQEPIKPRALDGSAFDDFTLVTDHPTNPQQNSTPGGGARKTKFAEQFPTLESFLAAFTGSEWETKGLNLPYYFTRHTNYSEAQNVLQANWFLTCCNWFSEDELKNKLVFLPKAGNAQESQIKKRGNSAAAAMEILNRTRNE